MLVALIASGLVFVPASSAAVATGSIEGKATAASGGAPIENVLVCAYQVSGGFEEACDLTNGSGVYLISNLPVGKYKVEFRPRYENLNYLRQYYNNQSFWELADKVSVTAGTVVGNIDAQLQTGGQIEGEVTAALGGAPIEEILVCAEGIEGESGGCALTDASGKYTIAGLPADEYKVEFWPGFELNFLFQYYDHKTSWEAADPVPVSLGATAAGIDAQLDPGAQIKGTVSAASSGAPLAEIVVCAIDAVSKELVSCAETGSVGQYALHGLSSGPYKVVFSLEFSEWYGEEVEVGENDGYLTQFYNGKATLALADTLNLTAPGTVLGVDAHLVSAVAPSRPSVALPKPPIAVPSPLRLKHRVCPRGKKLKRVKGKLRCVRAHRKRHHHSRGHGRSRLATRG